jgi:hypothetical protein
MIRIGLGWGLVETICFSLNMMVPLQGGVWWLHHKLFFNYRYFTISLFLSQKKKKFWGGFLSISQRRTKHPTWWRDDYINEIIRHAQKSTTTTVLLLQRPPLLCTTQNNTTDVGIFCLPREWVQSQESQTSATNKVQIWGSLCE